MKMLQVATIFFYFFLFLLQVSADVGAHPGFADPFHNKAEWASIRADPAFVLLPNDDPTLPDDQRPLISRQLVAAVNSQADLSWVAGPNEIFVNKTRADFKAMLGGKRLSSGEESKVLKSFPPAESAALMDVKAIPASFDSGTYWSKCQGTIYNVRTQYCGTCWAYSTAGAFSDRWCLYKQISNYQYELSAEELIECCANCLSNAEDACGGGYAAFAWSYIHDYGIVTTNCFPENQDPVSPPSCPNACEENLNWATNRGFASFIYQISSDTTAIQTEIMQHGPVTAHMIAYDDLSAYQSGIYRHTYGALDGGHFVRIVGWGSYLDSSCNCNHVAWLVFNSWGPSWGISGAFWIWEHDSSIGDEVDAGLP